MPPPTANSRFDVRGALTLWSGLDLGGQDGGPGSCGDIGELNQAGPEAGA